MEPDIVELSNNDFDKASLIEQMDQFESTSNGSVNLDMAIEISSNDTSEGIMFP